MPITLALILSLFAQATPAAAPDPQAKPKAQALLKEGTALYERGDLVGALEKFEGAYSTYPSPKLQFNIGQANRDLGRPVEALTAFESFLASSTDAAPELVAEARQSVTDLAGRLGRLKIECPNMGAQATLDGKPLGLTPIDRLIWVVPGRHQITFRRSAFMPVIADVNVAAGQTQVVRRTLLMSDPAPPSAPPPTEVVAAPPPSAPAREHNKDVWSGQRWYFWAGASGTVVFAAGAIASGLSASARFSDLQGSCGKSPAGCAESQIDTVKSRVVLTNVLWALAGVSAVATGVAFYVDSREAGVSVAFGF